MDGGYQEPEGNAAVKRATQDLHDGQNYDSFLDIVANLVGILVILIMVIGVRARDAWQATDPTQVRTVTDTRPASVPDSEPEDLPNPPAAGEPDKELARLRLAILEADGKATAVHRDIAEMDAHIQEIERLTEAAEAERNELQLLVSMAEQSLEKRRQGLDERQQTALARSRQVDENRVQLASLLAKKSAIESEVGAPNILQHHPTPIAKAVFGAEEHFRLLHGRVSFVPINEMTQLLRRDAENKLWKLGSTDAVTETIGPVEGYRMKYTLHRRERRVMTEDGPRLQRMVELERFVMVPQSETLGEPVAVALTAGSEFQRRLAGWPPDQTTVTIWTYPDSFPEFRQLKDDLTARGFTVAARPLPSGYPIGGSPDGSTSSAQ